MEILCLEQMHGTELEQNYASTEAQSAWNMGQKLIYRPEQNGGFIETLLNK